MKIYSALVVALAAFTVPATARVGGDRVLQGKKLDGPGDSDAKGNSMDKCDDYDGKAFAKCKAFCACREKVTREEDGSDDGECDKKRDALLDAAPWETPRSIRRNRICAPV